MSYPDMVTQVKPATSFQFKADEMIAVSRDEFIPGTVVPADVFLKLTEGRYVLIARNGTKASFADLHVSERSDVANYYVRKVDYKNCVGQNLTVAGILLSRKEVSDSRKTEFLSKTADTVFKEISVMGFNHEAMAHSKQVADNIQTLVASKEDLHAIMTLISNISGDMVRHAMAVSAISVMIAKGLHWLFPQTLEKLALGGLLHDVGLKELPSEIVEKPRHLMSAEEVQIYETHVYRGVEILQSMPSVPEEVIAILFEHHENAIGQGYPRKLRDFKMTPLAKVVALADAFADLTLKNPNNPNPKAPAEAIDYLEITLGQPFNKITFAALKTVLNLKTTGKRKQSA